MAEWSRLDHPIGESTFFSQIDFLTCLFPFSTAILSQFSFVMVWNAVTGRLLHQLPGHKGSVNDVIFHPSQPIIASASSDRTIFLGELA
jgi:WD40 repeat protein